jgi:hypothetical protein
VCTGACEAGLHLVGNAHASLGAHSIVHALQVSRGWHHLSAAAHDGLRNEGAHAAQRTVDELLHLLGVQLAGLLVLPHAVPAAESVGESHHVRGGRLVILAVHGLKPFVRRDVDQRLGMTVVRGVQDGHVIRTGRGSMRTSDAQRQIVGLATRVNKVNSVQLWGHGAQQLLHVTLLNGVQETAVRLDIAELLAASCHHSRVRVPHRRYIIAAIQMQVSVNVLHVYAPSTGDNQATILLVEHRHVGTHTLFTLRN